jgi:hypothetical protein
MDYKGRHVQLVAGLHGNEKATVRALESLKLDFILGNPDAASQNKRFIDEDLNASFGKGMQSNETRRAAEILTLIPGEAVVIDFHTTSANSEPFAILTNKAMLPLAERTGCTYAVLMTHNIKSGHALINHRDGISVEISGYDTQEAFKSTVQIIKNLESEFSKPIILLEVFDKIIQTGVYENFVQHAEGFFPILVGEQAYDFLGLKARRIN